MPQAVECFTVSLSESSRGILHEIAHCKSREDLIGECQERLDSIIATVAAMKSTQIADRKHAAAAQLSTVETALIDAASLLTVIPSGASQ